MIVCTPDQAVDAMIRCGEMLYAPKSKGFDARKLRRSANYLLKANGAAKARDFVFNYMFMRSKWRKN